MIVSLNRESLQSIANFFCDIKTTKYLSVKDDVILTKHFYAHIGELVYYIYIASIPLFPGLVASLLDEQISEPLNTLAKHAESLLATHGAYDLCFQAVTPVHLFDSP